MTPHLGNSRRLRLRYPSPGWGAAMTAGVVVIRKSCRTGRYVASGSFLGLGGVIGQGSTRNEAEEAILTEVQGLLDRTKAPKGGEA
jgi:hypothetical protein